MATTTRSDGAGRFKIWKRRSMSSRSIKVSQPAADAATAMAAASRYGHRASLRGSQ